MCNARVDTFLVTVVAEICCFLFDTDFLQIHFQVLAGCISGSLKLITEIRNLHHVLGGALNPVSYITMMSCRL